MSNTGRKGFAVPTFELLIPTPGKGLELSMPALNAPDGSHVAIPIGFPKETTLDLPEIPVIARVAMSGAIASRVQFKRPDGGLMSFSLFGLDRSDRVFGVLPQPVSELVFSRNTPKRWILEGRRKLPDGDAIFVLANALGGIIGDTQRRSIILSRSSQPLDKSTNL